MCLGFCRHVSVILPSQTAKVSQAAPMGMSHRNVPWEASAHTSLQQGTEHLPSTSSPAHLTGNYIFQLRKLQFSLQGWCLVPEVEQDGSWQREGLCPGALPMCWALWDEDLHHLQATWQQGLTLNCVLSLADVRLFHCSLTSISCPVMS